MKINEENVELKQSLNLRNLKKIHKLSILVIVVEMLMILLALIIDLPKIYLYAYIILFSTVLIFYFFSLQKNRMKFFSNSVVLDLLLYIFTIWGIAVSAFDASRGMAPFVYIINISFIICFYIATPICAIVYNLVNMIIFYFVFFLIDRLTIDIVINFTLFHLVMILISIDKYKTFVMNYLDKMQLQKANDELQLLSTIDQLSGCKNRRGLNIEIKKYEKQVIFVLLTDIDNFKEINDCYGHDIGDLFIVNYAKILQTNFGVSNVFRLGGDEFFIISNNESLNSCLNKFEISIKEISNITLVENQKKLITISGGYSYTVLSNVGAFDQIYKDLDVAMYKAKKEGKNKIIKAGMLNYK
ncbi:MAG: GGDEF domain-containing protein [Pleomorphochaeta sp.]